MDAVKELADAAGMEVPAPDPRAQERAERAAGLYEVMEAAAALVRGAARRRSRAARRAPISSKRGISEATAAPVRLRLRAGLRAASCKAALKEFGNDKLVEAGLLIAARGGPRAL